MRSRTAIKCMKTGKMLAFFATEVKTDNAGGHCHFARMWSKQSMLYFLGKAAMVTTFWL